MKYISKIVFMPNILLNFSANIRLKFYLIIAFISLTIFFYSVSEINWVIVNVTDFLGLISHLTLLYWIGLLLITFCAVIAYQDDELDNDLVFTIILAIIGLFLFGLGVFVEENARAWSSYYPTAEVNNILITHHIDTISSYPVLSYRYWPAFHLISACILYLTDLKLIYLIKYMPLFWVLCYSLIAFAIGKRFRFSSNQSFLLALIAISSYIQCHYYYSPNSFAGLNYITLFWIIICLSYNSINVKYITLFLLVLMSLIITHMLTSIALILSFISTRFLQIALYKKYLLSIFLIAVFFFSWYLYLTPSMFEYGLKELLNQSTELNFFNYFQSIKYSGPSETVLPTRTISRYFCLSYPAIFFLCMIFSVSYYALGKIDCDNSKKFRFSLYWIIGILMIAPARYGYEMDERTYAFSLIPMASIIILSFSNNKKFLAILCALFVIMHNPASYAGESCLQTYTSELAGGEFFAAFVPILSPFFVHVGGDRYITYHDPINIKNITYYRRDFLRWNPTKRALEESNYIIDSRHTNNLLIYFFNFDFVGNWIQDKILNIVYNNGAYEIYKR